ncbi:MAG: hypothetical protein ACXADO_02770 [Candidatus Thorarchaeota archaeon]|jgi:hypothetical protein
MSSSKSPDNLGTYAVVSSYILMIGGIVMFVIGTVDPYLAGNVIILFLSGILAVGGILLRVLGAFLWGPGSKSFREEYTVLEIVAMRQSVTISELQTETGYPIERIEEILRDALMNQKLTGYLENDKFVRDTSVSPWQPDMAWVDDDD